MSHSTSRRVARDPAVGTGERRLWWASVVIASLLSAGCYSAANQATAQSAQASFKDAKIGQSLDEEKKASAQMAQSETAAVRRALLAARDQMLALVLDSPWASFRDLMAGRRDEIMGGQGAVDTRAKDLARLTRQAALAQETLELRMQRYKLMAVALKLPAVSLSCPSTGAPAGGAEAALKDRLDSYADACRRYLDAQASFDKQLDSLPSGDLKAAVTEARAERAQIAVWRAESTRLEGLYDKATVELEQARRSPTGDAAKKLDAAISKVRDALEAQASEAKKSGNPFAKLAEVLARAERVSNVINDITAPNADPKVQSDVPIEVRIILRTTLSLEALEIDRAIPLLQLEATRLRNELDAARSAADYAEWKLANAELQVNILISEARDLDRALGAVSAADTSEAALPAPGTKAPLASPADTKCVSDTSKVYDNYHAAPNAACRNHIAATLLYYASSWSLGRLPLAEARMDAVAAAHDRAIDESAAALAYWEAVLSIPIDQVAAFHSAGIKPEDLAQIVIQGLGLGFVGTSILAK